MHDHGTPDKEAKMFQRGVLSLLLHEHRTLLTMRDVEIEIGSARAAADAVCELVSVGLLRREGDSVLPTRAALHFNRLDR